MGQGTSFGEWLRKNSEKYLLEAAGEDMARRYPGLCSKPFREEGFGPFFWRKIFVPIYSMIPWDLRRKIILFSSYPKGERPHWKRLG